MQALLAIRQSTWQQQLRDFKAVDKLHSRQFDQFPLTHVQGLTNDFIKAATSRWSLGRTGRVIAPFSADCDKLLDDELTDLKQRADTPLGLVHVGVLACIHVLTTTTALAQLSSLIPNFEGGNSTWDEQFDEKVALYLQCLIIAHRTRPKLYSHEALAAKQLLRIALAGPKPKGFPTISLNKLFGTVGPGAEGGDLLPDEFISVVLDRARFKATIGIELERLRAARKWYEAYTLVKALHPLLHQEQRHQQNRATTLIQEFIPHYTFWAAWKPSRTRVELWKNNVSSTTHWSTLSPVLDLEGPDVTGHQRSTIRQSPDYLLSGTPGFVRLSADLPVLERILELFDIAASIGPHSIDLFIWLCITSGPPSLEALAQLESALEAARSCNAGDLASKIAKDGIAGLNVQRERRLSSIAQVLVALTRIPELQPTLGVRIDIKRSTVETLSAAQAEFCYSLDSCTPNEALAHDIVTLAHAMLDATWLHPQWQDWYRDTLARVPSHGEVESTFRTLRTQPSPTTRAAIIDHLGTRLGDRSRRNTQSVILPDPSLLLLIPQEPIWYSHLDPDRTRLRETLKTIPSISPTLATSCLQRALDEDTPFVRALNSILTACSDTVCVNLANFLGTRTLHARFQVDETWKSLLLHMMKQLPSGIPGRVAVTMDLVRWQAWAENLRRVLGTRHLDPHGGMGFTEAKFQEIARAKMAAAGQ